MEQYNRLHSTNTPSSLLHYISEQEEHVAKFFLIAAACCFFSGIVMWFLSFWFGLAGWNLFLSSLCYGSFYVLEGLFIGFTLIGWKSLRTVKLIQKDLGQ